MSWDRYRPAIEVFVELRHLRYFVAVGEEEHFGRAAERLHVVQPALTRQIRQLEEEIGCALFQRLTRGVRLTEAGKSFLEEARRLLADLGRSVDRTRLVAQGKVGRLRVGFSDTATYSGELSSILHNFRARWPDVRLELFPSSSVVAGEQLRRQEVDVAFVYVAPTDLPDLKTHTISVERWVLALPHTHPLVKRKRVKLRDLKEEPFVWFPRPVASPLHDRVLAACHAAGLTLNIVQEVNNPTTMLSLVAGGIGVTFTITSAEKTKPDRAVLREVDDLRVTAELSAIWRGDNKLLALQKFIEMVRQQCTGIAHSLRRVCLDTLYGADPNAQLSCDGAYSLTLGELSANTLLDLGRHPRPAKTLSLGLRPPEPSMYAFYNHGPLELGKYAKHLKQRLASRRGCINALLVKVQIHTLGP